MNVLFFNEVAASVGGGRNQYALDVANRLRNSGVRVALVHGRLPASAFAGTGYVFNHLGPGGGASPDVRLRLQAILEDFAPDVIQLQGMENLALEPLLREHAPTVRFVHNHVPYCSGQDMTHAFPRRICERAHGAGCLPRHALCGCGHANPLTNWLRYSRVSNTLASLRALDGIQVASPVIRDNLARNGIDPAAIELIPMYAPEPSAPKRGQKPSRRMLFHPGGLVKNKGVWLLLKGLETLPPDVDLVFAGGGDQQADVEAWVKNRGLGQRVQVMGDLAPPAWSTLFHQSTLVVFPSRWNEPLGLAGIHAMAHGKPVLAFEAGGVTGWLRDGVTGRLVKFNDGKKFLAEIAALLAEPKTLAAMGKAARQVWETDFHPAQHIARLVAYYKKIAARGRREIYPGADP